MPYRTLGELRSELMSRLGMGAMGASGASQSLMNSFLRNGQHQIYWAQDWKHLTTYADLELGMSQNQLDVPTGCAADRRILRIETVYGGQWRQLAEGIETEHWSTMETAGYPQRVERFEQLLIYPRSDAIYTVRVWFVRDLARFSQDGDRATLDDDAILLHAITNAKAHYRHPDAELYQGQLATMMSSLRGQSFKASGVYRRSDRDVSERKPAVVGRDA